MPEVLSASKTIAVMGNPNTGKSTLFNALTGMKQKVGNFPGCTVEKKLGRISGSGGDLLAIDLPGTYSLAAASPDEMIAVDVLMGVLPGTPKVDAVLVVLDASNLHRNMYLLTQVLEVGLPVVAALNMTDIAAGKRIEIDAKKLSSAIGIPVLETKANSGKGIPELREALFKACLENKATPPPDFLRNLRGLAQTLAREAAGKSNAGRGVSWLETYRALVDEGGYAETRLRSSLGLEFEVKLRGARTEAKSSSQQSLAELESKTRYEWISQKLSGAIREPQVQVETLTDRLDKVLAHRLFGLVVFSGLMLVVFQAIYSWSGPLMDFIDSFFGSLGDWAGGRIENEILKSFVVDGVIAGVGGVVIFLPQIAILFFFIAIFEDCGYMARGAFLMDKLFSKIGLSGKSFLPLMSSFACAIPGIMAARTIENRRDRITTIMIAPLMSCSARLPVYFLLVGAFVPDKTVFLHFTMQGLTIFAMYWVGVLAAIPVAWFMQKRAFKGQTPPFLMELPSYKMPGARMVLHRVYDRSKAFLVRAGTIIFALSIVIWALTYFPHSKEIQQKYESRRDGLRQILLLPLLPKLHEYDAKAFDPEASAEDVFAAIEADEALSDLILRMDALDDDFDSKGLKYGTPEWEAEDKLYQAEKRKMRQDHPKAWPLLADVRVVRDGYANIANEESGEYTRDSYLGKAGHFIEPAVKPLGWDWRIGMAAIASFPAREVIISTLGTIYNLGTGVDEKSSSLREKLRREKWPDGKPVFNLPVALSIMVFFALCAQCMSTLAIIKRETNSWKWPVISFSYMTVLAYVASLATYQIAMAAGFGA